MKKHIFHLFVYYIMVSLVYAANQININKATAKQLTQIKGIGPKKANAIVKYRTEHGNFKKIEDIMKVKG